MLERIREARRNESGFTLVELLMVIVILGVLAGIVVFAVNGIQDRGKTSACQADVKIVSVAAESAYAKNNVYPADMAGLVTSGFLHQAATDVDYSSADGKTITKLEGKVGSDCAGYKG